MAPSEVDRSWRELAEGEVADTGSVPETCVTDLGDGLYRVEWMPKVMVAMRDQVTGELLSAPPAAGRPTSRYARALYRQKREVGLEALRRHVDRMGRHAAAAVPGSRRAAHFRRELEEGQWLLALIEETL